MSYILQAKVGGDYRPHPEGIHAAVCVDMIPLGLMETEFQGERRMVEKVRLAFETECRGEDGKPCVIMKTFTSSIHAKSKLSQFLGQWRGRLVAPGEKIDLTTLIGLSCTLVISHRQNLQGRTYASIDAVSKPSKRLQPSGNYDPAATRQRIAEWKAKDAQSMGIAPSRGVAPALPAAPAAAPARQLATAVPSGGGGFNEECDPDIAF